MILPSARYSDIIERRAKWSVFTGGVYVVKVVVHINLLFN